MLVVSFKVFFITLLVHLYIFSTNIYGMHTLGRSPLTGQAIFLLSSVRLKIALFKVIFFSGNKRKSRDTVSAEIISPEISFRPFVAKNSRVQSKTQRAVIDLFTILVVFIVFVWHCLSKDSTDEPSNRKEL